MEKLVELHDTFQTLAVPAAIVVAMLRRERKAEQFLASSARLEAREDLRFGWEKVGKAGRYPGWEHWADAAATYRTLGNQMPYVVPAHIPRVCFPRRFPSNW